MLARAVDVPDAHIRVVLDVQQPEPGLAQRVRDQIPNTVDVRLDYAERTDEEARTMAGLAPEEIFVHYYRSQHKAEPTAELLALFRELYEEAAASDVEMTTL